MGYVRAEKTATLTALSHQAAAHPTTLKGSAIDCSTMKTMRIWLFHGYVEAAADTNPGSFLIQVRPEEYDDTSNENWITVSSQAAAGTTPDTEALTATEPAGETVLAVASTTGFALADKVYVQDAGTVADGEWGTLAGLATDTSLTLLDGLARAKDSSDVIWNDSTVAIKDVDVTMAKSLRVVWQHTGATGANGHVKALAMGYAMDRSET